MTEQKNKADDRPLTLSEAADFLRVSDVTMRKLIHEGKVRAVKAGRDWRITRAAIDEFLKGGSTG